MLLLPRFGVLSAMQGFLPVRCRCYRISPKLNPFPGDKAQGFCCLPPGRTGSWEGVEEPVPLDSSTSCRLPEFFFSLLKKNSLDVISCINTMVTVDSMFRLSALADKKAQILFGCCIVSFFLSPSKA